MVERLVHQKVERLEAGDLLRPLRPDQRPMDCTAVPIGAAGISVGVPQGCGGQQQGAGGMVGYPKMVPDFFDGTSRLRGQQLEKAEAETGHENLELREAEPGDVRRAESFESPGKPPLDPPEEALVVSRDAHVVVLR